MVVSTTTVEQQIQAEMEAKLNMQVARLKNLVRDMYGCLLWQYEPHPYMGDGCNCCARRPSGRECGVAAFAKRARELGLEVDA